MSDIKGCLSSCDWCGKSIFRKCTGSTDLDGGYSVHDTYEKLPEGWSYLSTMGRLCPECFEAYNRAVTSAKNERIKK